MISAKQLRFLIKGAKKLNAGVATIKRFGKPAEEVGMTAFQATKLHASRLAHVAASNAAYKSTAAARSMAQGMGSAREGIGRGYQVAAESKRNIFARGMANSPGLGSYFAKPTLNRMPAAQGAGLKRKAQIGAMQVKRTARRLKPQIRQRIDLLRAAVRNRI